VQAAVAGEQPERAPAFVDVRRGGVFEPADIVAPETKAGQANRQPAAQAFGHRFIVGVAVAAPVHRELLRPTDAERANSTASSSPTVSFSTFHTSSL
jgi:hypothetical protein